jgi:GAF domain-containing protein
MVAALGAAVSRQQTSTIQAQVRDQHGNYQAMEWNVTGQGSTLFLAGRELSPSLSRRAADLETVAAISMATARILDMDRLLQEVVDVTRERFDLYHAHIYRLNAGSDALELAAGAGDVGREMVARGQLIPLDQANSPVAEAARSHRVVLREVLPSDLFLPHPLLPQTRSEMAVPMIVGDQLVGVLDVQDDAPGRFDETDAHIFTTLAAQTAVAMENARSFARAQEAVAETNVLMRLLTREGWEGYLGERSEVGGYLYDAGRTAPLSSRQDRSKAPLAGEEALTIQRLQVHDQVIGELALVAGEGTLDDEAGEVIAAVAEQLSARLENLRLTTTTQMALTETASLYQAGSELNRANSYADVLDVLHQHTVAGRNASASVLVLFDQPWTAGRKPAHFAVVAYRSGFELDADLMQRVAPPIFGLAGERMQPESPTFIADVTAASALPAEVRAFFSNKLQGQSALFVPLTLGGQWIGYLTTAYRERASLSDADLQRVTTLAGQAAAAVQSIYLLQAAEERARQERILRELSTRVRNVTDIDLLMKTAVREIGQVLGRETFLYLGADEQPARPEHREQQGLETG